MRSNFNGDRLRTARTYRGMTLAELGDSVNLSKQTLSLYENNRGTPDFSAITKLSNSLHFPTDYFYGDNAISVESGSTYFRSLTSTTKKSRIAEVTKAEFIGALYESLYEYIDFPSLNLPTINIGNLDSIKIEKIALLLRDYWGLGDKPITDLQYTLEENGIIVVGTKVDDKKIDAYSQHLTIDGYDNYIVVLSVGNKGKARINFDLAHELGHMILHPWTEDIETLPPDEFKDRERQANKFASSLLLPKTTFKNEVVKFPNDLEYYVRLKSKWGVSIQAMIYRANDLGVITNNQFQYLMKQISKNGWRKKEPGDFPHELNDNIFKMAIDLLLENDYTKKDILEIFNKSSISLFRDEIENLLNLPDNYLYYKEESNNKIIKLKSNYKNL
ncbi:XRE family transcriptional regulator [Anaerococcus sp.]|uniref:helix-turn-helix domain-containing protein n=1 Tax=Anaerococcus sp. TaxID=1872515 RepID=UPI00257BF287|nr:XRE family transcriptional regulator [Anaerococcus sp.]MBS6105892.1 XRE family transcriptional regulator [Anaerococcus sp.]